MVRRGFAQSPLVPPLGAIADILLRVADVDPATLPVVPPLEEIPRGGIVGRAG